MKFKNTNCDKTKKSYFYNSNSVEDFFTQSFGKNNFTPQQPMRCTLAIFF